MTTSPVPQGDDFSDRPIRPVQYRDLEDIEALTLDDFDEDIDRRAQNFRTQVQQVRPWFGLFNRTPLARARHDPVQDARHRCARAGRRVARKFCAAPPDAARAHRPLDLVLDVGQHEHR